MSTALITAIALGVMLAAALHLAHRDDVRREHHIDDIIARRYTQPTRLRVWHDDNYSTATSVRTSSRPYYGADVAVDPLVTHTTSLSGFAEAAHADDRTPATSLLGGVAGVQERDNRPGTSPAGVNNRAI